MVREAVEHLVVDPDGSYVDGTGGTGGHSAAILRALSAVGRLVVVDQDPDALAVARARLGGESERVRFHRGSFHRLDEALSAAGLEAVDGILLDLGLNSWTLARPEKGLSYTVDVPLGMALDPDLRRTAADLLANVTENQLARLLAEYGGVRRARLFARRIVEARRRAGLRTTGDLVRAVQGGVPGSVREDELSQIFQAVRVEVGEEMARLEEFLARVGEWVKPRGRLVIISYGSHEDSRAKDFARSGEGSPGGFGPLLRKTLRPGEEEIRRNRRARSARMRVFVKGG